MIFALIKQELILLSLMQRDYKGLVLEDKLKINSLGFLVGVYKYMLGVKKMDVEA